MALAVTALAGWSSVRSVRWASDAVGCSVSFILAGGGVNLWWTGRTDVFGSYDRGLAIRTIGLDEWRWFIPPGGNEVIPPYAHFVWGIKGIFEWECDDGMWADGGAARSVSTVLWPWALLFAGGAMLLLRSARRARRQAARLCVACGHPLHSRPDPQAPCPECGRVPPV